MENDSVTVTREAPKAPELSPEVLARAEASQEGKPYEAPAAAPAKKEELILGKFKTDEDVRKAYVELEKKLGAPRAKESDPKAGDKKPVEKASDKKAEDKAPEAKPKEGDAQKVLEEAGLDFSKYSTEFTEKGDLSEESIEEIVKGTKVTKEQVSEYVAGQKAIAQLAHLDMVKSVGGEEVVENVTAWAVENLPAEELEAYNASVKGAPKAHQVLAFKGLQARMQAVEGKAPKLVGGSTAQADHGGYANDGEMFADMKNPLYNAQTHAGAAFRALVKDKVAKGLINSKRK